MTNIVQFPRKNKGRIRKSTGSHADGIFAMMQFESYPKNVEHFQRNELAEVDANTLLALAFDILLRQLSIETRKNVKHSAMVEAALGETPRKRIVAAALSGAFPA